MTLPHRVLTIIRLIGDEHGVSAEEILSDNKTDRVYAARKEAMRVVKWLPMPSGKLPSYILVGRWFDRDHSTVYYACKGYEPIIEEQLTLDFYQCEEQRRGQAALSA
jgi:chromosomal replication initiation ATPase DnaA